MTAALLFAATFAVVLTLGVQQINVERRLVLAAAVTSPLIGLSQLVLFKVLPGPTLWVEIAAYLAGGSAGIVASIWAHPRLVRLFAAMRGQRAAVARDAGDDTSGGEDLLTIAHDIAQHHAERLGETLRLATQIADESARADVEINCTFQQMGNHTWYDTASPATLLGADAADMVATALRYLRLRDRVVTHPTQSHLVRFA